MIDLKDCPFCGHKAVMGVPVGLPSGRYRTSVWCVKCAAEVQGRGHDELASQEMAAENWNMRSEHRYYRCPDCQALLEDRMIIDLNGKAVEVPLHYCPNCGKEAFDD
jgi:DNA-directed RNA polymerase subunit RPC12/RpoP